MICITKFETLFSGTEDDLQNLKNQFDKNHYVRLPGLLESGLLKFIQNKLDKDKFLEDRYKVGDDSAVGYRFEDENTLGLLLFLINDEKLFHFVQKITSCKKIGCFTGRVYSKIPDLGQYDSWHDDLTDDRMVAISINLSTDVYSGGDLEILDKRSDEVITVPANKGFGEGIIFRLAPYLEHRVTKVYDKYPRTVLTGWFRSEPAYKTFLSSLLSKSDNLVLERKMH